MAIEIIKKGKKLNPKYRGTCNHCECVFSFQNEDILTRESWRNEQYAEVRCPYCGKVCSIGMDGVKVIEQ